MTYPKSADFQVETLEFDPHLLTPRQSFATALQLHIENLIPLCSAGQADQKTSQTLIEED